MDILASVLSQLLSWIARCKVMCLIKSLLAYYHCSNSDKTKILFKNSDYIIVDKNYDTMMNSNDSTKLTVQTFLRKKYPCSVNKSLRHEFFFVHRLDYATSGVVCIALNKNACREASLAFQNRNTKKYYIALIRGHVSKESINVNQPIGEDSTKIANHKMCTSDVETCCNPRNSHTKLLVLELGFYDNYPATKVLLRPVTGRRHQLRVHCSYLGHTIVGDFTYSNRKDVKPDRMYLHSLRLVLPISTEVLDIRTEDPFTKNMTELWLPIRILNEINANSLMLLE